MYHWVEENVWIWKASQQLLFAFFPSQRSLTGLLGNTHWDTSSLGTLVPFNVIQCDWFCRKIHIYCSLIGLNHAGVANKQRHAKYPLCLSPQISPHTLLCPTGTSYTGSSYQEKHRWDTNNVNDRSWEQQQHETEALPQDKTCRKDTKVRCEVV